MTLVKIEVCVDDLAGLHQAVAGGADRIELCARLDQDGLTPTPDLLAVVNQLTIPVRAMIRPLAGPFVADAKTLQRMIDQIGLCRRAGCEGVVFGLLDQNGALDSAKMAKLCAAADRLGKTLHRAVDRLSDPRAAVQQAETLGFDTILSSGGAQNAAVGVDVLRDMVALASKVDIMPGAGVSARNAAQIISATGARWLHGSFRAENGQTDAAQIATAKQNLAALSRSA